MRKLIIDRYEGQYTICEDMEQKFFAIESSEIPKDAKTGDVLSIDNEGIITIDAAETEARKTRINNKQNKLYSK